VNFHTRDDQYLRIRQMTGSPNNHGYGHTYWFVETKDGMVYRFGYNADSEQLNGPHENPNGLSHAWMWGLDQVADRHGNTTQITWLQQTAVTQNNEPYTQAAYPQTMTYGGNRQITFTYFTRPHYSAYGQGSVYSQYY